MKKILCILLLLPCFPLRCYAESLEEETARLTEVYQVEQGLEEDEREISGELRLDGEYDAGGALKRLWDSLCSHAVQALQGELGFALKLLLIALLCSMAAALSPQQRSPQLVEIAACCTAVLLLAGPMDSMLSEARETLYRLSDYSKAAVPAFFTTVAASGSAVSASVKYAAVCFVMDLMISLSQRLILPLILAYFAISVSGSLFDNAMLASVGRFIKWCAVTTMSLLTMGFCVYIGLSGVISGSADAAAVKAAKTAISTALPVVGGILSDSAAAMLAAASLIRNSAGVFCLVAVCAICAGPFTLLAVKVLIFKAAAALAELACGGRFSRLLGSVGTVFALLLGLIGSSGMMLFYSFMSGIRMTGL